MSEGIWDAPCWLQPDRQVRRRRPGTRRRARQLSFKERCTLNAFATFYGLAAGLGRVVPHFAARRHHQVATAPIAWNRAEKTRAKPLPLLNKPAQSERRSKRLSFKSCIQPDPSPDLLRQILEFPNTLVSRVSLLPPASWRKSDGKGQVGFFPFLTPPPWFPEPFPRDEVRGRR